MFHKLHEHQFTREHNEKPREKTAVSQELTFELVASLKYNFPFKINILLFVLAKLPYTSMNPY